MMMLATATGHLGRMSAGAHLAVVPFGEHIRDVLIDTEPRGRVRRLAQQPRGQTPVQRADALFADDSGPNCKLRPCAAISGFT